MALFGNATTPNGLDFFFATAGGGGGGGLQSPVVVTPVAGTGNATIAVIADPAIPAALAGLSVVGSSAGPGNIIVGGYGTDYNVGVPSQPVPLLPSLPQFEIGVNDGVTPPALTYNGGTGAVVIGDGSAAASATVELRQPLVLGSTLGGANRLIVTPNSGTSSQIVQTIASGGVVEIGSSQAYLGTLQVSDVAKNGSANYVEINGTAGSVPLFLSAAQGVGGNCYIYPDSPGGASVMNVGSSQINPSAISMTDGGVAGSGRTVIANLAPPSLANNICSINGQQASIPTGVNTITLPAGVVPTDGLWYFAVNVTGVGNPQFQASCIVYYNGATWSTGGSTQSAADGNGKYVQLYPSGANMTIAFNGSAAVPGYVVLCPLFNAPIIGFA